MCEEVAVTFSTLKFIARVLTSQQHQYDVYRASRSAENCNGFEKWTSSVVEEFKNLVLIFFSLMFYSYP